MRIPELCHASTVPMPRPWRDGRGSMAILLIRFALENLGDAQLSHLTLSAG